MIFQLLNGSSSKALLIALAFCFTNTHVRAAKDDSYYPNGIFNPNVNTTMYWQDARNVLQDLSLFQSLSVKFHSCAWSELTDGDDDEAEGGGEDDSWYYGSVRPYGANVAFSLYGTLLGDNDHKEGCSRQTYINSFYTTAGFTAFSNSMAAAGIENFVYYQDDESGDGNDDDDTAVVYSAACSSNADDNSGDNADDSASSSFGVACTNKGNFAVFEYSGSYCRSDQVMNVSDWMLDYNANLEEASCVEIYNVENSDDDNSNDGEQSGSPLFLLEQSAACSLDDIGGACPDPYWKLHLYARILRRATGAQDHESIIRYEIVGASLAILASLALLVSSIVTVRRTLGERPSLEKEAKVNKPTSSWGAALCTRFRQSQVAEDSSAVGSPVDSGNNSIGSSATTAPPPVDDQPVQRSQAAEDSSAFGSTVDSTTIGSSATTAAPPVDDQPFQQSQGAEDSVAVGSTVDNNTSATTAAPPPVDDQP